MAWITFLFLACCFTYPAAASDQSPGDDPLPGTQAEIAMTGRGGVEMHVNDLPLSVALQLLSVQSKRNIVASPSVKGTVTANLYDVTFEEALEAILLANGAGYREIGSFIYVYTQAELAEMAARDTEGRVTRVFSFNYLSAEDARSYISPLIGEDGVISTSPAADSGISSGAGSAGGNSSAAQDFMVVTTLPEKMREIERILRQLDIRPKQALIEATILRAELTDENALGIDFAIVGGVDLSLLGATSTGIADVRLGSLPQDRFERFNAAASTGFTGDVPGGGITIGVIKDNVAVFLRALEQVTDITVLANPKVLALNKQKGQVIVGRRDGFLTTTVTQTQAIQTVEFLETGTQLIFRPFIGDDGFIRVELHPEDSVGFVNAQGLPSEQTTEVTTNVIVRDGETILIGGLFREVTTDTRSQVPWLGGLPGIGALFRSKSESTAREEVIILLTIHVVKDHAAYAAASAERYEDVERLRVGIRRGLMWHGRGRIAQSHYGRAVTAVEGGDVDRALYHLNMSLHNNSRLLPAIRLKEKILSQRAWHDDGSGIRGFLMGLVQQERGRPSSIFGRPTAEIGAPAKIGAVEESQ